MNSSCAPTVANSRTKFPIVFWTLLLLVVSSFTYFVYYIQPTAVFANQQVAIDTPTNTTYTAGQLDLNIVFRKNSIFEFYISERRAVYTSFREKQKYFGRRKTESISENASVRGREEKRVYVTTN